ncbi:hypothetical protein CO122_00045 [bacterium (Candidatus Gribaldobacteria) CG_4_9_14_3_um_filter_33_9]|nr:MAG: hypothetical protein CO122_00045 [bacterium (Candidatus Gribaldobacteria) CG_4_9_14_3_um_filter_33_9]
MKVFLSKQLKYFIFIFVAIFIVNFLVVNWKDFYWIFNQKAVFPLLVNSVAKLENNQELENTIEIPSLGIEAPIIFPKTNTIDEIESSLKKGVVHFPLSVLPGENGMTVIVGHSAPPNWPKINYDGVFSRLNDLKNGDEIFVWFNNHKYIYKVKEKYILKRGESISDESMNSKSILALVSCWPPGKDYQRMLVRAELKN